ncbi:MAG: MFS transporter, partial [Oceanospirillaceae bacterium]|nr:MFS transporter [Oceanospirillaceae bacterium]
MLSILRHRVYRHLFAAQVISLLGTGLATVALSLMAFELAGDNAGTVLATALTIKMLAYVFVSPLLAALFQGRSRKPVLVLLDIIRALTALSLPFLIEVWHIYVVIFVLQSSSAGFTPLFQATIPDVLPDEREYTKALSLSRLAYDMESLISPMLAAALLLITSWHGLFFGTMLGFVASALLVLSVTLPKAQTSAANTWTDRLTKGGRIYLLTPRLRGLLLLSFTTALGGAMVFVNTVVLVQGNFALSGQQTAFALAAFGFGSMLTALTLPTL